jgi:hypothetical protein
MIRFYNAIKKRNNFIEIPFDYKITDSELLNNSIFSKKWYLYDNDKTKDLLEGEESSFLATNINIFDIYSDISFIVDNIGEFIEENYKSIDTIHNYVKINNLISDETSECIDNELFETIFKREWICFLHYKYFDGQHNCYWLINTNKNSLLFEYVFVYDSNLIQFFHFSEMDNNMKRVKQICKDFDLLT